MFFFLHSKALFPPAPSPHFNISEFRMLLLFLQLSYNYNWQYFLYLYSHLVEINIDIKMRILCTNIFLGQFPKAIELKAKNKQMGPNDATNKGLISKIYK